MIARWTPENEEALQRAEARLRESAEKFGPLGRPADSSCACQRWPCRCRCHEPPRGKMPA
jgi:Tfp pilus assembly protein PilX